MVEPYLSLATSTTFPENFNSSSYGLLSLPLYMNLREHHCISPARPAPLGGSSSPRHDQDDEVISWDEGLMNGWFPHDVEFVERGGEVRAGDGRYVTWMDDADGVQGGRARRAHDEDTCEMCRAERARREDETRERARVWKELAERGDEGEQGEQGPGGEGGGGAATDEEGSGSAIMSEGDVEMTEGEDESEGYETMEGIDEEDEETRSSSGESEYSEYVENTCSGITDIILTGEVRASLSYAFALLVDLCALQTLPRHGQAWHAFRFFGRIRRWDGLIALVRVPAHDPNLGVFIFRGYVHGGTNFVGSWRSASSNVHAIPFEGPFVVSRVR